MSDKKRRVVQTEVSAGMKHALWDQHCLDGMDFRPSGNSLLVENGDSGTLGDVKQGARTPQKPALVGSFVMGLNSGWGEDETFTPEQVREEIMKAFPEGGTIYVQLGWYRSSKENSVRVVIENSGMGLSEEDFMEKLNAFVRTLVEKFRQKEIWVDYYRGSETVSNLRFWWE